jgi:hypothetical protein
VWNIPHPDVETTDQAAWLIDYNNQNVAIEAGFNIGESPNGGFESYMYPYYTRDNGNIETDFFSTKLPTDQAADMIVNYDTSNNTVNIDVAGHDLADSLSYNIPTPRWNYAQAEVISNNTQNSDHITMAGNDDAFNGYYLPAGSNTWQYWGFNNECVDTPYWITYVSPADWNAGGSGN